MICQVDNVLRNWKVLFAARGPFAAEKATETWQKYELLFHSMARNCSKIYFSSLLEDRHSQTASCETRKNEVLVINVVFSITTHVKLHHACCFQWRPIFCVWQPFYNFRSPKGDFEKHCACSTEMAGKEQSCSSCFKNTKYDCL